MPRVESDRGEAERKEAAPRPTRGRSMTESVADAEEVGTAAADGTEKASTDTGRDSEAAAIRIPVAARRRRVGIVIGIGACIRSSPDTPSF